MVVEKQFITETEFDAFVMRPENADKSFELIYGEIVEVVSNPKSSNVAARLLIEVGIYLKQHDIGHITGADGGYKFDGQRYIPDVGVITYEKQPELSYEDGYIPNAPDFAIEVISPSNTDKEMLLKVAHYLEAGTLVWLVYPQEEQIAVYEQGKAVKVYGTEDKLTGSHVLPNFTLAVKDIFQ